MNDMSAQHYDPETFPYEVHGFYEELIQKDAGGAYGYKLLGTRRIPRLTRTPGAEGRITVFLTETVELRRGHKFATIRASPQRPLECFSMLQIICGKSKQPHLNPLYR